jgi:hypothetical protein
MTGSPRIILKADVAGSVGRRLLRTASLLKRSRIIPKAGVAGSVGRRL